MLRSFQNDERPISASGRRRQAEGGKGGFQATATIEEIGVTLVCGPMRPLVGPRASLRILGRVDLISRRRLRVDEKLSDVGRAAEYLGIEALAPLGRAGPRRVMN